MDNPTHADVPTMLKHHHEVSKELHEETHEKLDDLENAAKHGRDSYHHKSHGVHHMYDSGASGAGGLFGGGAGGVLGGGIGGLIGGALGSGLFGRGFRGGWDGGCGDGGGHRGGSDCCCVQGAETRIEDAINFGSATNQRFDMERDLGDIKREIAGVGAAVSANINRSLFEMQIAACQASAAQLMAIEQTKFAAVTATKDAQNAIILNQQAIAFEQLKQCCERDRLEGERRHGELQIQVITNQNTAVAQSQQQQMQLLEERNARRADRHEFQIANLMATFQAQLNQQNVQNKSVTIGTGTSGANSTNTANNV